MRYYQDNRSMKHKGSLVINKPIAEVAALFADPNSPKEYQDGFIRKELLSGEAGENGAVYELFYSYGGRDMVMTETIVNNSLPEFYEAFYHHEHMDNTMKCHFTALDARRTRYDYEYEYTRMNWIMPKLMAILFPGVYRRQGEKWMQQFKEFVERQ